MAIQLEPSDFDIKKIKERMDDTLADLETYFVYAYEDLSRKEARKIIWQEIRKMGKE